ncbi:MAG: serine--tRNA ligase [Candidatus Anstonellaceae archaeon]
MLDIKQIRQNPQPFFDSMKARGLDTKPIEDVLDFDKRFRLLKKKVDELKHQRNQVSLQINEAKKNKEEELAERLIRETQTLAKQIKEIDEETINLEKKIFELLITIPNQIDPSVPIGKDSFENKEVERRFKPELFAKDVLPHYEIGRKIGLDFERGVLLAGSRFTVLWSNLAKLERALAGFMLDLAAKNRYTEILPPYIVNQKTMFCSGQLPKFKDELYKIDGLDFWLIPTAEVPLVNLHANEVLEKKQLPIAYCALTPCFRKEAGNYQKDIKGIIRQHQFNKVELVRFCTPENSNQELKLIVQHAKEVLEKLQLPYRIVELCSGDLGFSAAKTYDLEVWIPSQETYREISSCSNCTDFQARRANIKYRNEGELYYVHTLNASGLAIGRTMVAILENYQKENKIVIPEALVKYIGMEEIIIPK